MCVALGKSLVLGSIEHFASEPFQLIFMVSGIVHLAVEVCFGQLEKLNKIAVQAPLSGLLWCSFESFLTPHIGLLSCILAELVLHM